MAHDGPQDTHAPTATSPPGLVFISFCYAAAANLLTKAPRQNNLTDFREG